LNPKELIEYTRDMDKFFHMEEIEDVKRVEMAFLMLKYHASIWWHFP